MTLEPKDEMKERLNADWLAGRISRDELEKRLQTRSDMRIKSIAFTESKSKSDGVATPMFLLGGGSSVSIAKSRNTGKSALAMAAISKARSLTRWKASWRSAAPNSWPFRWASRNRTVGY